MEIPPIHAPRTSSPEDCGYAHSVFQPQAAAHMPAQAAAVFSSQARVNRRSGAVIVRHSSAAPTQLEKRNASEPASAMPFIFIGAISAAEKISVPKTLAAVVHIAARGSDRANSARMITVEQAMPGRPTAE